MKNSMHQLLVMANIVPSPPILVNLMVEALSFSETSVLSRATLHNIPEDGIFHSHYRENLKSYKPVYNQSFQLEYSKYSSKV
jgi:hypothetical protein